VPADVALPTSRTTSRHIDFRSTRWSHGSSRDGKGCRASNVNKTDRSQRAVGPATTEPAANDLGVSRARKPLPATRASFLSRPRGNKGVFLLLALASCSTVVDGLAFEPGDSLELRTLTGIEGRKTIDYPWVSGILARDAVIEGIAFPAGTAVSLRRDTRTLQSAKLVRATVVHGVTFASGVTVECHEDGTLWSAYVPEYVVAAFQGMQAMQKRRVLFYRDGKVREIQLGDTATIQGETYERNEQLTFDTSGHLKTVYRNSAASYPIVPWRSCSFAPNTIIYLYPGGSAQCGKLSEICDLGGLQSDTPFLPIPAGACVEFDSNGKLVKASADQVCVCYGASG
jgi:hypothetical protein